MASVRNRRYSLRHRVLLAISSTLIVLMLLELGARACASFMDSERVLRFHSTLGWLPVPGARKRYTGEEEPYLIQINSFGFRGKEFTPHASDGLQRLIVLGDSFVFGSGGVDTEHLFSVLMDDKLDGINVYNLGVPAFSTDQEFLTLAEYGPTMHPDIVVLCMYENDFPQCFKSYANDIGRPKGYFTVSENNLHFTPPRTWWFYSLTQRSYLCAMLDHFGGYSRQHFRSIGQERQYSDAEKRQVFKLCLSAIANRCSELGAQFVLVYIPSRDQTAPSTAQSLAHEFCRESKTPFLDIATVKPFSDHSVEARKLYFDRDIHLNRHGHRVIADLVSEFVLHQAVSH